MSQTSQTLPEKTGALAARQIELFKLAPVRQTLLNEILRLIRSVPARHCLEIGVADGAFSHYLRNRQVEWHTLLTSAAGVEATRTLAGDRVDHFVPPRLPFDDKQFELIVLVDPAEAFSDFEKMFEECHRVLQTAGHIVLNLPYAGKWSPLRPLRRLLERRNPDIRPNHRAYDEETLFAILKSGFDVLETRHYARFFTELTRVCLQTALISIPDNDTAPDRHARRLRRHRIALPLFRIAFQLDYLLYPLRGHHWIALARRHSWRPRNQTILEDAKDITGAVLSTVR